MESAQEHEQPADLDRHIPVRDVVVALLEHAPEGVVVVGRDGRIAMANARAEHLFHYAKGELAGQPVEAVLPQGLPHEGNGHQAELQVTGKRKDGYDLDVHLSVSYAEAEEGRLATAFLRRADDPADDPEDPEDDPIAESEASADPASLVLHDPLTGLPGRRLLLDRLSVALARSARRSSSVAVLLLDLDRFGVFNDKHGRDIGDRLLVAVGERLFGDLRPGDTVARLGPDEFVVLCDDIPSPRTAAAVADRVHAAVSAPFGFDGGSVSVRASLGWAVGSGPDDSAESLMHRAEEALQRARNAGGARLAPFEPVPDQAPEEDPSQEEEMPAEEPQAAPEEPPATEPEEPDTPTHPSGLIRAVQRRQFRLLYQPIIHLTSGRIAGVEALLRWEDPERGLLGPAEFMDEAEETGLIVDIGAWALEEACREAKQLQEARPDGTPLMLAVNLSARQLAHPGFTDTVQGILAGSTIEPGTLYLEIGESSVMEDADAAMAVFRDLHAAGVRLSIDDFGTGYSSLVHLKRFPLDFLKIDRSFVAGVEDDAADAAIVSAVISMGHALGLALIAEGVETEQQLGTLRRLGCDLAQGYLFARPDTAEAVVALLEQDPAW